MTRLVWFLRRAFCAHEWGRTGESKFWRPGTDPEKHLPAQAYIIKECKKCGWIWRQRL